MALEYSNWILFYYRGKLAKDLLQHMDESDHENKDYVECPLCKTKESCHTFSAHYQECVRKGKRTLKCPFCDLEYFPNSDSNCSRMVYHKKSVHFWGRFKCLECKHVANFARDLIKHMSQKHELSNKICCPSCKDNFAHENIQTHYEKCSREKRKVSHKKSVEKKMLGMTEFKCEQCHKSFKANSRSHRDHMKLKHSWGVFKCQTCSVKVRVV